MTVGKTAVSPEYLPPEAKGGCFNSMQLNVVHWAGLAQAGGGGGGSGGSGGGGSRLAVVMPAHLCSPVHATSAFSLTMQVWCLTWMVSRV